jgi:hypothetical protein
MHLLYPCDPFDRKRPDPDYAEEYLATQAEGLNCAVFSLEDFAGGVFRARPALPQGAEVVYRGWMLVPDDYARLAAAIAHQGAQVLTSPAWYRVCHYLPEWYALCEDVTPKTVFLAAGADYAAAVASLGWRAYFVKDYVKSLTTRRGSVAASGEEIAEVVAEIERCRGRIEGGVCVREFEDLRPETEERYFVLGGRAYGRDDTVPETVTRIAQRIGSPFFSVDMVIAANGALRLIELGDGQVSDRKKWPVARFVAMLHARA